MDDGINKALVFGSQIVAVLIVVTGAALQKAQLKSARPPGGAQVLDNVESGDRYARLWEDPLEGMQAFTPKGAGVSKSPDRDREEREIQEQRQQIQTRKLPQLDQDLRQQIEKNKSAQVAEVDLEHLVLWNVLDARPIPEAKEARLRIRYALVSALVTAGYQPVDDAVLRALKVRSRDSEVERLVGFTELFENKSPKGDLPRRITVVWHPLKNARKLRSEPEGVNIGRPFNDFEVIDTWVEVDLAMKSVVGEAQANPKKGPRIVILHHGSSGDFAGYVQAHSEAKEKVYEHPQHRVIFTRATAQPYVIAGVGKDGPKNPVEKYRIELAEELQAGASDEKLIEELAKELKVRIPALSNCSKKRIVIFTESDGAYGRNLAQLITNYLGDDSTMVEVYGYLRGLDGLPGELEEDSKPDGGAAAGRGLQEKNWGTSQYDYLRRIAVQLRETNHSQSPIVAIGVLGSDVYDKLLVLQAVHPELSGALYFTTDLQSLFLTREHLPFTRNLVVAAGEGLEIDEEIGHSGAATPGWRIPSMRDSYQTALVHTVWDHLATPSPGHKDHADHTESAKVWEVGQGKFVELDAETRTDDPGWLMKLLAHVPVQFLLVFLGLVNAILILFAVLSRSRPGKEHSESLLEKKARVFLGSEAIGAGFFLLLLFGVLIASLVPKPASLVGASGVTALILFAIGLRQRARYLRSHPRARKQILARLTGDSMARSLLALSVFFFILSRAILVTGEDQHLFGEPLDPIAGVGMWPSILLRLAAFLVGLLLLIITCKIFVEGGVRTKQKLETIEGISGWTGRSDVVTRCLRKYDAVGLSLPGVRTMQNLFGMKPGEGSGFFLDSCLDPSLRSRRIVLGTILYFLVSAILFSIWTPMVPGRGGLPFLIEKLSLSLGVGLYIVHLCLCVELHLCACGVIRYLTKGVEENRALPMEDIVKIAKSIGSITSVVGFTLLYPLTILSLLLISRLRLFDDWGMPPSLILTFLFGGIVLIVVSIVIVVQSRKFSAVVAQEVARRLDEVEKEEDNRKVEEAGEDKAAIEAKMSVKALLAESKEIAEIYQGAFAKWYRQPIFIAVLAAAAIFGSLEMAQPALSLFFG